MSHAYHSGHGQIDAALKGVKDGEGERSHVTHSVGRGSVLQWPVRFKGFPPACTTLTFAGTGHLIVCEHPGAICFSS